LFAAAAVYSPVSASVGTTAFIQLHPCRALICWED